MSVPCREIYRKHLHKWLRKKLLRKRESRERRNRLNAIINKIFFEQAPLVTKGVCFNLGWLMKRILGAFNLIKEIRDIYKQKKGR